MSTETKILLTPLTDSLKQFVQSAYSVAPGIVIVITILSIFITGITLLSSTLMVGTLVILVVFTALLVFTQRNSFGDATLSLVGGLLTVLRTEWTIGLYISFIVAWLGFALMAFLISSIKLAAQQEDIIKSVATKMSESNNDIQIFQEKLENLTKLSESRMLSPLQRAEVIQLLAFRKVSLELFPQLLNSVEVLSTITKIDIKEITTFLVDFSKIFKIKSEEESKILLDKLYQIIRDTPVPPQEFFEAFAVSRRILLQETVSPEQFLEGLRQRLEIGVAPKDMYSELHAMFHE